MLPFSVREHFVLKLYGTSDCSAWDIVRCERTIIDSFFLYFSKRLSSPCLNPVTVRRSYGAPLELKRDQESL